MYKLFLCLKYLRKRALAYFAMLGVVLCVFMMLVVVSVLNGFMDKIEQAAKGLFGDVTVSAASLGGLAHYDEFAARIKREVPAVESASPFILTFGIMRVPDTDYRRTVQVAGIRLPERVEVSDFEKGLFIQAGLERPTFDPPGDLIRRRLQEDYQAMTAIRRREQDAATDLQAKAAASGRGEALLAEKLGLVGHLDLAMSYQRSALMRFRDAERIWAEYRGREAELVALSEKLDAAADAGNDAEYERLEGLIEIRESVLAQVKRSLILPPARRVILGRGIPGLTRRTEKGETIRTIGPGQQVVLTLIPLGRKISYADITPTTESFTVIDDCSTDVSTIDSEILYLDFQTLQQLNNMAGERNLDDPSNPGEPGRCSEIHVKIKPEYLGDDPWTMRVGHWLGLVKETPMTGNEKLQRIADQIDGQWREFRKTIPWASRDAIVGEVRAEPWRRRQRRLVSMIENQRTLMMIILGIVSFVAVVLIFVIMYVIVVQKTRDIGVLKAVGASSGGVAAIFLAYGAAIGLVGSMLGALGGWCFVRTRSTTGSGGPSASSCGAGSRTCSRIFPTKWVWPRS